MIETDPPVNPGGTVPGARRIVFLGGHAATGKSTLGEQMVPLGWAVIDKDKLSGFYRPLCGNPDPESPRGMEFRAAEYSMMDQALKSVATCKGASIMMVAPYGTEFSSKEWLDRQQSTWGNEVVHFLWLPLPPLELHREIMQQRGSSLDEAKLADFASWRSSLSSPGDGRISKPKWEDLQGNGLDILSSLLDQ